MAEYLCDSCTHQCVCCNKAMYKAFQDAASELSITIPSLTTDDERQRSIKDISWLKPTKLDCINYKY